MARTEVLLFCACAGWGRNVTFSTNIPLLFKTSLQNSVSFMVIPPLQIQISRVLLISWSLSWMQWATSHNVRGLFLNCKYKHDMHHLSHTVKGSQIPEVNFQLSNCQRVPTSTGKWTHQTSSVIPLSQAIWVSGYEDRKEVLNKSYILIFTCIHRIKQKNPRRQIFIKYS